MSREIKFRAWDSNQKHMVNPEITFGNNRLALDISGYPFFKDRYEDSEQRSYVEETFILMQFTGIRDKKGKRIYEGDIVENYAIIDKVVFENGSFILSRDRGCSTCHSKYLGMHDELEVIGNIYKNPELIE